MQNSGEAAGGEQEEEQSLAQTAPFDGKVLILSEAGKPIFYRFF